MTSYIYKIFRSPEWQRASTSTQFHGSDDDIRDGFIHFSTRGQLATTIDKYFSSEPEIHITAYDTAAFDPNDLRWEPSRGGALFPHLYAPLERNCHTQHWCLHREKGIFDLTVLPEET